MNGWFLILMEPTQILLNLLWAGIAGAARATIGYYKQAGNEKFDFKKWTTTTIVAAIVGAAAAFLTGQYAGLPGSGGEAAAWGIAGEQFVNALSKKKKK